MHVSIAGRPRQRNRVRVKPEALVASSRKAVSRIVTDRRYSLDIRFDANFPLGAGLGGSAAYAVALCRGLLHLQNRPEDDGLVARTAFEADRQIHGMASGIDTTTVAFEAPCYVKTGEQFVVDSGPPVHGPVAGFIDIAPGGSFVLAYSGVSGSTRAAVQRVAEFARTPGGAKVLSRLTAVSETIALQAATALRRGDFDYVGIMLQENQYLLRAIGLSTPRLDALCAAAVAAGAYGAKFTGGGLGGYVIAVVPPDKAPVVARALASKGARNIFLQHSDAFSRS